MAKLTFFYDLSSPWTYLAFNNVHEVLEDTNADVTWRPFLVGGVFNAVNQSVYAARSNPSDPKVIHNFTWLHEWARLAGLPLDFPTEHHPVKSVLPMRACCALEDNQPLLHSFTKAAFDAYFAEGRNIDDPDVVYEVQADDTFPVTDLFGNFDIVYTSAGSTLTGISGAELDVTTGATNTTLPIKAIDISQDPNNSDTGAANTNVLVVIQNSIFGVKGAGLA